MQANVRRGTGEEMKISGSRKAVGTLLSITLLLGVGMSPFSVTTAEAKSVSENTSSSKYTYEQDPVPQVIKNMSPSVVGIIGKTSGGNTQSGEDRYNLTHGTGVIFKSDGWIITNAHVVDGYTGITVVTADNKTYKAKKVFSDTISDIALVKINAKSLTPAKFAKSSRSAQVGEQVIAIGTPVYFTLRNSATVGVVSGLDRSVDSSYRLIQTDTAINPGNSGGPLVNLKGEVIGINSMKFSGLEVENMGFSIPTETVQYVTSHLLKYGEVKRAGLGLALEESWSAIVGLPSDDPLTVTKVLSVQAKKAGIKEDDVLYSINGKRVYSVVDINEMLKNFMPGAKVNVLMQSDGDIVNRMLTLSSENKTDAIAAIAVTGEEQ
ncbi:trypsin-like peptidase domain-containing protein [Paenibacillus sp. N3/727]|uniref:S1C family serine protease n=1 Tax=Paenibacillus sp. N3/727 TaxID=2925845 RepID=UPI001F52FD2A|nr:trypsin-like peptidase domain-containing protein [Paenibacillus sp. N3/727]UNK18029.1 trypsin-like peptidase domain-containing protein [Paenibacillus sp. N3/727]